MESKRNPVVVIDNIELENEKFELSRKEKMGYMLDFSECMVAKTVSYFD